ncbi:TMC family membrane protein [Dirofilaria immitis]|nr:TMC family membrane protein [Dirofilaria immitis]
MHGSAASLIVSQKDGGCGKISPVTALFPTSSIRRNDSRSSLNQYYLSRPSLYDKSYVSPTHQSLSTSEIGISPSQLHSPSIISTAGSTTSQVTLSAEPRVPRIADTQTKKSRRSRSRTNSNKDIRHEFVPWRSVTEVQHQVSGFPQLQQKSEIDFSDSHPSKSASSHLSYMKTAEDFETPISNLGPYSSAQMEDPDTVLRLQEIACLLREQFSAKKASLLIKCRPRTIIYSRHNCSYMTSVDLSTSQQCQRRFRISVSPSRRFQTQSGPSGSDTDTSTGKRRYVIKQEMLPDSTVSIDMGDNGTSQHRKL